MDFFAKYTLVILVIEEFSLILDIFTDKDINDRRAATIGAMLYIPAIIFIIEITNYF